MTILNESLRKSQRIVEALNGTFAVRRLDLNESLTIKLNDALIRPMKPLRILVIFILICATVCQCNSLRTRANQIRVARVRQLRDASGDE